MKKLLLVLLVVALASFLFVGCLPTTPAEGEGEGEGEVGICPTVSVTSQVAVGGKNYIKGGTQTITVTFAVPTEPVSVYVGNAFEDRWLLTLLAWAFLPWTVLMFLIIYPGGIVGFDWVLLILGIVADVASYSGGFWGNRKAVPGYE